VLGEDSGGVDSVVDPKPKEPHCRSDEFGLDDGGEESGGIEKLGGCDGATPGVVEGI
jgi:hypothetical protein